jgi:hypothetical protein
MARLTHWVHRLLYREYHMQVCSHRTCDRAWAPAQERP